MEPSLARRVHVDDTINSMDGCASRKVRTFHMLHVLFNWYIGNFRGIFRLLKDSIDMQFNRPRNLCKVVRRYSCSHPDCYAVTTIQQQIWQPCGKYGWLHLGIVKVGLEVDYFLFNVVQHVFRNFIKSTLGISHSCWRVSVNRTEVPLAIDERIP